MDGHSLTRAGKAAAIRERCTLYRIAAAARGLASSSDSVARLNLETAAAAIDEAIVFFDIAIRVGELCSPQLNLEDWRPVPGKAAQ